MSPFFKVSRRALSARGRGCSVGLSRLPRSPSAARQESLSRAVALEGVNAKRFSRRSPSIVGVYANCEAHLERISWRFFSRRCIAACETDVAGRWRPRCARVTRGGGRRPTPVSPGGGESLRRSSGESLRRSGGDPPGGLSRPSKGDPPRNRIGDPAGPIRLPVWLAMRSVDQRRME